MGMFSRIVALIIALLVLVVVAIGLFDLNVGFGGRILDNYRSTVDEHTKDPVEATYGEAPSIPAEHQATLEQLQRTIKRMVLGQKTNCFGNYKITPSLTKSHSGFPEFGEDGPTITITYNPSRDVSMFTVKGGAGGKQEVLTSNFEVKNMIPCIIDKSVASNFKSFVDGTYSGGEYYSAISTITLGFSEEGPICTGANSIIGQGLDPGCNFKDGGTIFTPDNNHICFIPTDEGLSDTFVSASGDENLPSIIARRGLSC
jgi:hypothetical protein